MAASTSAAYTSTITALPDAAHAELELELRQIDDEPRWRYDWEAGADTSGVALVVFGASVLYRLATADSYTKSELLDQM